MILLPYNFTENPFASFALVFDGDQSLSLVHYDSARSLLRIVARPWLTRPDAGTALAILDSLHVANPLKVTFRDWYPSDGPNLPEWSLYYAHSDPSNTFVLHTPAGKGSPAFISPIRRSDLEVLPPIFDHPPIQPGALDRWLIPNHD